MKKIFLFLFLLIMMVSAVSGQTLDELRQAYVNKQYGLFFCFNLVTWQNAEVGDGTFSASRFNPSSLDMGEWIDAAKNTGFNYAVLTAKHHDGFCLWDASGTTYDIASSPYKSGAGDLVKEFIDTCRSRSINPIIYFSILDKTQAADTTYIKNQLTQLLSDYGDIPAIWFDGWQWAVGYDSVPYTVIRNHVKSIQPNCLILENNHFHNYDSTDLMIYEKQIDGDIPAGNTFLSEITETIRTDNKWFWNTGYGTVKTTEYIVSSRQRANSRNAAYLLAVQPDTFGVIPTEQMARLLTTDTLDNSILIYDSLTASTTLTAGTYYVTTSLQTKDYPLYFDLRNGDVVIKPKSTVVHTIAHNGNAVCSTYTGSGRLIFTSVNDDRYGERITGSTGAPDSSNVTYPYLYSTGTGSDYLYDVSCNFNYTTFGTLVYNNSADALTKNFIVDKAIIKNCVVPLSGGNTPYIGAYSNSTSKLNTVSITNCSIDSTNHMSDPTAGALILTTPASSVTIAGNYLQASETGTGSVTIVRSYHIGTPVVFKNNLLIASSKVRVGYFPIMNSGACTTFVYNNTFYGPNKASGSAGEYLYGVSASGNINYSNDNVWTGWENATNIRNHTVVRVKEVFYNNTANASAGAGNTVGTAAFTTDDPTFTTLSGLSRDTLYPHADGWVVGNTNIKKHGSRTVSDLGLSITTNSFDGSKLSLIDTITAGIYYNILQQISTGYRRNSIFTMYNSNYGATAGQVKLNTVSVPITFWSNDSVKIRIPSWMGRGYYTYKVYNTAGTLVDSTYRGVRIMVPQILGGE